MTITAHKFKKVADDLNKEIVCDSLLEWLETKKLLNEYLTHLETEADLFELKDYLLGDS